MRESTFMLSSTKTLPISLCELHMPTRLQLCATGLKMHRIQY